MKRVYHGWKVVGGAFLVAVFGWGLGFYGVGVFVATLRELHGWSASTVSAAVTVYYLLGATLIAFVGLAFERFGPRAVVLTGIVAMATGAIGLTQITDAWQLYLAFPFMAVGWACLSGAAINVIVAPWFDRKRGQAVSLAFNGASFGGILIAPALVLLIARFGYTTGVWTVSLAGAAILVPLVLFTFHRGPEVLGLGPDGGPPVAATASSTATPISTRWEFLRSRHFWTVSTPFALALMAQVGFITHQVSYLKPTLGDIGAGWAVSLTTAGAVIGRLIVATFVDRVSRRAAAAGNFLMQATGVALLLVGGNLITLYAGCILFGLGVGNTTSLPSLIVQTEFPKAMFGRVIGTVIAINQFTYAFGPSVLGALRDWQGGYALALGVCSGLYVVAAALIILGRPAPAPVVSIAT